MIPEDDVDVLGRTAARYVLQGKARSISEAIAITGGDPRLSHARVRKHLKLLEESIVGDHGARQIRGELLDVAITSMDVIDGYFDRFPDRFPEARGTRLVGRPSEGHLEGEVIFRLRVFADIGVPELVEVLEQLEAEDPVYAPFSAKGVGQLDQLKTRIEGISMIFTICPPNRVPEEAGNLSTGERMHSANCEDIRALRDQIIEGQC